MKVNWCSTCGGSRNFGDQLGPTLLRHFGYEVEWASPAEAEYITIGSILSKVPNGWTGTVFGTGFIRPGLTKDLSQARVLAVRGEFTRKAARLPVGTMLGDPGVLAPHLLGREPKKTGALVIPHTVDKTMVERHPGVEVASIQEKPAELVAKIAGAAVVFTSSLHALIAADSLGVPTILEPHEAVIGGMFKFNDYSSALGGTILPGVPYLSDRYRMHKLQERLRGILLTLRLESPRGPTGLQVARNGGSSR